MKANCEQLDHLEIRPLSQAVREVASIFRRHRLNYSQSVYVVRQARKAVEIGRERPTKRLPKNLSTDELMKFFAAVESGGNPAHLLMFRLLYATGVRVSELANVKREDLDLPEHSIRINSGKGKKDRIVLYSSSLQLPLRLHLEATTSNRFLFESRRKTRLSSRWLQLLCARYGTSAGIEKMHCHRLRHSLLTDLTREGLGDAQIMLLSGHGSKQALECYQSLSLRDVKEDYNRAMQGK